MLAITIPVFNLFSLELRELVSDSVISFYGSFDFYLIKEIDVVCDFNGTYASGLFLNNIKGKISEIKKPLYIYENFKLNKLKIYKDHTIKKSGIYCLINNINGHFYIGCTINIKNRMSCYLSNSYLNSKKNSNQPIIKALLKYGQENFSLIVIEHLSNSVGLAA